MAERVVALVGLRGSGKSSVGRALAERLGWPFVDLDERLAELHAGSEEPRPAGRILAEIGEEAFRDLEARALGEVLAAAGPFVLATGGGVVERPENRELLLERCRSIWLDAEPEVLLARIDADPTPRPALTELSPSEEVVRIAARRSPLYAEVAEVKLDSGRFGIRSLTAVIFRRLRP